MSLLSVLHRLLVAGLATAAAGACASPAIAATSPGASATKSEAYAQAGTGAVATIIGCDSTGCDWEVRFPGFLGSPDRTLRVWSEGDQVRAEGAITADDLEQARDFRWGQLANDILKPKPRGESILGYGDQGPSLTTSPLEAGTSLLTNAFYALDRAAVDTRLSLISLWEALSEPWSLHHHYSQAQTLVVALVNERFLKECDHAEECLSIQTWNWRDHKGANHYVPSQYVYLDDTPSYWNPIDNKDLELKERLAFIENIWQSESVGVEKCWITQSLWHAVFVDVLVQAYAPLLPKEVFPETTFSYSAMSGLRNAPREVRGDKEAAAFWEHVFDRGDCV